MHGRAQPLLDSPALVRYGLPAYERGVSPAAGAHFTQEITGQFYTRLLTVSCRLVCSAVAASRQVIVEYRDDSDTRVALAGPATALTASQTGDYFFSAWLGVDIFTVDSSALCPLPPLLLPPTYDFRIYVANIDTTDQLSRIRFTWERFYTTNEPRNVSPHSGTQQEGGLRLTTIPSLMSDQGGGSVPYQTRFAPGQDVEIDSVTATWNGTGASGTFLACLSLYSQDGVLLSRSFPSRQFAAGDTGVVTYAPPLGDVAANSVSWARMSTLAAVVCNNLALTNIAPVASTVNSGSAFGFDATSGYIHFLETGLFVASCICDFGAYFSPMTLSLLASVNPGGSIWPIENAATLYETLALSPPGMGIGGPLFLGCTSAFGIDSLDPTPANNLLHMRVVNDSGAARTVNFAAMQIFKVSDIP